MTQVSGVKTITPAQAAANQVRIQGVRETKQRVEEVSLQDLLRQKLTETEKLQEDLRRKLKADAAVSKKQARRAELAAQTAKDAAERAKADREAAEAFLKQATDKDEAADAKLAKASKLLKLQPQITLDHQAATEDRATAKRIVQAANDLMAKAKIVEAAAQKMMQEAVVTKNQANKDMVNAEGLKKKLAVREREIARRENLSRQVMGDLSQQSKNLKAQELQFLNKQAKFNERVQDWELEQLTKKKK